jgi:serine/threonine protein kinase
MPELIGQSLDRYHILERLGEGGMAVVYKAYDTRLEREVAVKVIRTERLTIETIPRALKRFEREAKALAKLNHANIIPIIDSGEEDGMPYLVMGYIPGGTLKDRLKKKPISWHEAANFLAPIARALDYAHKQGIVHRDIKPSNILITAENQPMLTDFGIARILKSEETLDLTGTGMGVGTPEYMAPEQGLGHKVDHRADIYALGIVLYEMVTGRKPFQADTPMAVVIKQINDPLPRPTQFVSDIPKKIEQVLLKVLAKDPNNRYQSMGEFVLALESLINSKATVKKIVPQIISKASAPKMRVKLKIPTISRRTMTTLGLVVLGIGLVVVFLNIPPSLPINYFATSTPSITASPIQVEEKIILETPTATKTILPTPTQIGGEGRISFISDRNDNWNIYQLSDVAGNAIALLPENHTIPKTDTDDPPIIYSWSPNGNNLLFGSYLDGRASTSLLSEGRVKHLFDEQNNYVNRETDWSQHSRLVAISSKHATAHHSIYTYDISSDERISYSVGESPDWHPDGTRIAYTTYQYASPNNYYDQIEILNINNSGIEIMAKGWRPQWSPNGQYIAYILGHYKQFTELHLRDEQGVYLGQISANVGSFEWSPKGNQIVYTENEKLYLFEIENFEKVMLFDPKFDIDKENGLGRPVWSPDGKTIAITSWSRDQGLYNYTYNIYVVMVDTKKIHHLGDGHKPVFSPGSKMLAFESERDGNSEIYISNLYGTELLNITNNPATDSDPDWIE